MANITVDFTASICTIDPLAVGITLSGYGGLNAYILNTAWKNSLANRPAEVTPQTATAAARVMRRRARAQGVTHEVRVPRSAPGEINPAFVHHVNREDMTGLSGLQLTTGRVRRRKVRRRVRRLPRGRGWVSLNDGRRSRRRWRAIWR